MKIYCFGCGNHHELLPEEAERIIQCLLAFAGDAIAGTLGEPILDRVPEENIPCLTTILEWADDAELYQEFVDSMVELREQPKGGSA